MIIRSKTIRLAMFISAFVIAAIVVFQLIWLRKVYNYEQKQFDHGIARAVRGFYEDIDQPLNQYYNLNQLIENISAEIFTVRISNLSLQNDSLAFYMQSELEDENIFTDCYFGIYSSEKKEYVYTSVLHSATTSHKEGKKFPRFKSGADLLVLYFPHRGEYILSLMNLWIIGSIFLLVVLILFSGSLYYFYRQKFLNETQKDFVNNFTHEFKTPVSVINLAAEVLARPGIINRPEKLSQYAAIVQYQGNYLQDQIEKLLRHAHAETHLLHLHKERVELHSLIEEALMNLQPLIADKKAQIKCELLADNSVLFADKGYLLIVITNLLENALKYAKDPKVLISTGNENSFIILSIKDNGKGIEKKYRARIFKKFFRVPNGEQISARGFGLGLAFVKRIVDSHHGKICLESIPGIGSDFKIKIPLL